MVNNYSFPHGMYYRDTMQLLGNNFMPYQKGFSHALVKTLNLLVEKISKLRAKFETNNEYFVRIV